MTIFPYSRRITYLFLLVIASSAALAEPVEKTARFHVEKGSLMRGERPFSLLAIEAPEDVLSTFEAGAAALLLNRICARGGNSVVVQKPAFPVDGPENLRWLENFKELAAQARWREMGVVLRLFHPGSNDDLIYRQSVVDAIARAMKGRWDVIYWIDGAQARQLTTNFKKAAPKLTVAGPAGADVLIGPSSADGSRSPRILYGSIPEKSNGGGGGILPFAEASFRSLEALHGHELEDLPSADSALLSEGERQGGFRSLFDGSSLAGWVATGDAAGWTVSNGNIVWVRRGGRYLRTMERYADFVLRLEWKIAEGGNSGVFIRAPLEGRWSRIGMEIQLLGDHGEPPHKNGTGSVYDVAAPSSNPSRPAGEWNSLEILCQGPILKITINDVVVQDLRLDSSDVLRVRLEEGFIALQDHGRPVAFRNIRIKRLEPSESG